MWAMKAIPDRGETFQDPWVECAAVTPNDSADLAFYSRGLYVGGAGAVAVTLENQTVGAAGIVFLGVPAGTFLPIVVRRVGATGTTATGIVMGQ